ncbi:MAG: hypothetical protein HY720_03320 [Planctomycetes bacterium]|nr:hypothetical protein [Planctomycetota bacterium]
MSLQRRLACLALLVLSVLALQSGAGWDGARSAFHRAVPLVRMGSFLSPSGGGEEGDSAEAERLRLALAVREDEIARLEERVAALTAFRGRYPDRYRDVVPAGIVYCRDPSPLARTIYLDRGASDGVRVGDAIVWGDALVGQVFLVQPRTCEARLLCDPKMRVPAVVLPSAGRESEAGQKSREQGVLVGTAGRTCRLEFVPWKAGLAPGDRLMTSGFRGEIPRGLVLGTVTDVANQEAATYLEVEVEPAVDPDRLHEVLVVRGEERPPAGE